MTGAKFIKVRRLRVGDGAIYRQIRLEALKEEPDAFGSNFATEISRDPASFEERVVTGCVFGAFQQDRIVGMAGFYQQKGKKTEHKGVLWGMYVSSGFRNSGAGRQLVQMVIDHAIDVVDLLRLAVVVGNAPAIALYTKMGFQTYGTEPKALKVGTEYFDEALMVLDLKKLRKTR